MLKDAIEQFFNFIQFDVISRQNNKRQIQKEGQLSSQHQHSTSALGVYPSNRQAYMPQLCIVHFLVLGLGSPQIMYSKLTRQFEV